ncbi:MAG: anchored repeat ABC transporter, substrate-binding protein [Bifidobacteriaceae bacterium]|jgi:surface-anchored protein|nr:anchored repeat ABC transporter, substrate-binding protein [Bifidobacteriaceae bacterium]
MKENQREAPRGQTTAHRCGAVGTASDRQVGRGMSGIGARRRCQRATHGETRPDCHGDTGAASDRQVGRGGNTIGDLRAGCVVVVVGVGALVLAGCAVKPVLAADSGRLQVVTTTGLLRDLVEQVGGGRVDVAAIVPDGADPHTYEPTLRDARNVVYADVAFSNYMLLEEHSIIKTLDGNLRPEAVNVSLAEESVKYAAEVIPLVEDANLDTIWLGLRVYGDGRDRYGTTRGSEVLMSATAASGPGAIFAYLTGTFGATEVYVDSSDGFDAASGYKSDTIALPVDAHTHLSWAFTEPGVYTLTLTARVQSDPTARPETIGEGTFTFAVGVGTDGVRDADESADAGPERARKVGVGEGEVGAGGGARSEDEAPDLGGETGSGGTRRSGVGTGKVGATQYSAAPVVLDRGHADITANLDTGTLEVRYDPSGGGEHTQVAYAPQDVIIEVPAKALALVPAGSQYSFLTRAATRAGAGAGAGAQVYQLPQAVLGKHVHGEIDPHLWQNVRNAMAYVNLIRDTLIAADPSGAPEYRASTAAYLTELEATDKYVRAAIGQIPPRNRHLVTSHDAFGYLAAAYGIEVAGFVTPNPATEPSLADRRKLTATIRTLGVPAVFLEPNLAARSATLTEIAAEQGVRICPLYGDTFDAAVTSYVEMMRFNADSLRDCLTHREEPAR